MIDTVPLGDMAEDMFGYFEPLYQVIPGMPRPPDAFLKRVAGETLARTLQVLSGLERGCRLAPLGLDCLPGARPFPCSLASRCCISTGRKEQVLNGEVGAVAVSPAPPKEPAPPGQG